LNLSFCRNAFLSPRSQKNFFVFVAETLKMSLIEAQKGMTDLVPADEHCGCDLGAYSWRQDDHEVVVAVPLPSNTTSKQLAVVITTNALRVAFKHMPLAPAAASAPAIAPGATSSGAAAPSPEGETGGTSKGGAMAAAAAPVWRNPVLDGALFRPIKADDSTWTIEDKRTLVITLIKSNRAGYDEWWPHVVIGEPQIDMRTLRPPARNLYDMDDGAQAQVRRMMFDQEQKRKGLPTSEEAQTQDRMMAAGLMRPPAPPSA
jgi:hypothetical protein